MFPLIRACRPAQWIKNAFVFLPLIFAGVFIDLVSVQLAAGAFLCFSAVSSAGYLVNDVRDVAADRAHPRKKLRPIAAGQVSVSTAYAAAAVLFVVGVAGAFFVSPLLPVVLGTYVVLTALYSLFLKHVVAVDVTVIAFGFVLRVFAGSVAIAVEPSGWLLGLTFLLALLLALGKRLQELSAVGGAHRKSLDGYTRDGLLLALAVLLGAVGVAYAGYLIFAGQPVALFATLPVAWAGLARYFLLIRDPAHAHDGPTELFFADRWLQALVAVWVAVVLGVLAFVG